jgi:hypothetical protein
LDPVREKKEKEQTDKFLEDMETNNKDKASLDFKKVVETKKEEEEISDFLPSVVYQKDDEIQFQTSSAYTEGDVDAMVEFVENFSKASKEKEKKEEGLKPVSIDEVL